MLVERRDVARYDVFSRRATILGIGTLGLFGGLAARLYYLQVMHSSQYRMLAEENRVNRRLLIPPRGKIYDRFGIELATNRQNLRVVLVPEQVREGGAGIDEVLDKVSEIIDLSDSRKEKVKKEIRRKPRFVPTMLAENLSWEDFARINVDTPMLPGIVADVGEARLYPFTDHLAHVVGYVAKPSEKDVQENDDPLLQLPGFRIGKNGLERTLDEGLRGSAGTSHVVVNAYGRVVSEMSRNDGDPGGDRYLTLDQTIQSIAMKRVENESAAVVVMDVHTGDILALVSAPAFDPNEFSKGLSQKLWNELRNNEKKPLLNKFLGGQYAPGSTFKIVSAMAGLEAGVIDPEEKVYCSGKMKLGRREFHCWKKHGHGAMNLRDAIKNSCNVYFFEMAKRMDIEGLSSMARKFGLGQAYDLGIPGAKTGLVPSDEWKRANRNIPWVKGDTLNTSIGQGFLLTTPIQLAVMTSRLANGGKMVMPRLIRESAEAVTGQTDELPDMNLDPAWIEMVREGMAAVINEPGGTAYGSRLREEGHSMAGKTGTVQVRGISKEERAQGVIKNEDLPWRRRDHGWFVGFGPVEQPRYAIAVLVEHGGGGSKAAAPVARDIMTEVLKRNPSALPLADAPVPSVSLFQRGDAG